MSGRVAGLRVVRLPGLPQKGDVSDWIAAGGNQEELLALVAASTPLTIAPEERSAQDGEPDLHAFVDGSSLLTSVEAMIQRFVVVTKEQACAIALWVMHTYVIDAAECTPYVNITSAEKQSGKTRLLEALALLVARPWFTAHVTAAVLVRKVAAVQPTLLLDESDAAFGGDKEYAETLRGVLNAGWRRGGVVSLCVKKGGGYDYQDFEVFGPKAIAGIGHLPDTVRDRAIVVSLRRRAPSESVERFRSRDAEQLAAPLREKLEGWAVANVGSLFDRRPDLPEELDDRAADCWEPLLVIAEAVGGDWAMRARAAAQALSGAAGKEDASLGVALLRDIKSVFDAQHVDRLASSELLEALNRMDEAPWGDLRGRPLDARGLAGRLKPYGVRPKNLRREGEKVVKGYSVDDFLDPWLRYIPATSATSATSATGSEFDASAEADPVADVADVAANPVYAGAVREQPGRDGADASTAAAEWEKTIE